MSVLNVRLDVWIICIVSMLIFVTPAHALEIGESSNEYNTLVLGETYYKEENNIFQNHINDLDSIKNIPNNTRNSTDELAPFENQTSESTGHPIIRMVGITVLIILLIIILIIAARSQQLLDKRDRQYRDVMEPVVQSGEMVDSFGRRVDAAREMIEQMHENDMYEWCPYMRQALQEEYELTYDRYAILYNSYIHWSNDAIMDCDYITSFYRPYSRVLQGLGIGFYLDLVGLYFLIFKFK